MDGEKSLAQIAMEEYIRSGGFELSTWASVAAAVVAAHEERKAKPAPIIGIGHGPCCTCQTCGKHYDDCICTFEAAI